jgi:hypothetical protein
VKIFNRKQIIIPSLVAAMGLVGGYGRLTVDGKRGERVWRKPIARVAPIKRRRLAQAAAGAELGRLMD